MSHLRVYSFCEIFDNKHLFQGFCSKKFQTTLYIINQSVDVLSYLFYVEKMHDTFFLKLLLPLNIMLCVHELKKEIKH